MSTPPRLPPSNSVTVLATVCFGFAETSFAAATSAEGAAAAAAAAAAGWAGAAGTYPELVPA